MKILTALSGILLALGGGFCYMYQAYAFSSLAFVMGVIMFLAGILCIAAYLVSGKAQRLPDTMLVESIVTILFGFAVLNNQVNDTMVSIFFGAWLTLAGASRLSQSVAISRYNPKEWVRVLPLAAICTLLGTIMMMPTLVSTINALILVGAAFILDGLSQLIYSMYMQDSTDHERAIEAASRAQAKLEAAKEKNAQQQKLRSMDEAERQAALAQEREKKREAKDRAKEAKRIAKEERRNARRDLEKTLELTEEEVADIVRLTDSEFTEPEEAPAPEQSMYPTFRKPTDIPSLRAASVIPEEEQEAEKKPDVSFTAINLAEIEESTPEVSFEAVVLPDIELKSSDRDPVDRGQIMKEINRELKPEEAATYTPLSLEELVAEPMKTHTNQEADNTRFTNTFVFNWDDDSPLKDI